MTALKEAAMKLQPLINPKVVSWVGGGQRSLLLVGKETMTAAYMTRFVTVVNAVSISRKFSLSLSHACCHMQ